MAGDYSWVGQLIQGLAAAYAAREATKEQNKYAEAASQPKWSYQSPYGANLINPMMPLLMSEALKMYQARSSGNFWGGDKNKNWGFQPNNDAISKIMEIMNPYLQNPQSYDPFGGTGGGPPGSAGYGGPSATWTRPGSFPDAPVKSADDLVNEGLAVQNPDGSYSRVPGAVGQNNREELRGTIGDILRGDPATDMAPSANGENAYRLNNAEAARMMASGAKFIGGTLVPGLGTGLTLTEQAMRGLRHASENNKDGKYSLAQVIEGFLNRHNPEGIVGKVDLRDPNTLLPQGPRYHAYAPSSVNGIGSDQPMLEQQMPNGGLALVGNGVPSTEAEYKAKYGDALGTAMWRAWQARANQTDADRLVDRLRFQNDFLNNQYRGTASTWDWGQNSGPSSWYGDFSGGGPERNNPYDTEDPWGMMGGHNAF